MSLCCDDLLDMYPDIYRMLLCYSDMLDLCMYPYMMGCCSSGVLVKVLVDWLSISEVP